MVRELCAIKESALAMTPFTTGVNILTDKVKNGIAKRGLQILTLGTRPIDAIIQLASVPIFTCVQEVQICKEYFDKGKYFKGVLRITASILIVSIAKTALNIIPITGIAAFAVVTEPIAVISGVISPQFRVATFFKFRKSYKLDVNGTLNLGKWMMPKYDFYIPFENFLCYTPTVTPPDGNAKIYGIYPWTNRKETGIEACSFPNDPIKV